MPDARTAILFATLMAVAIPAWAEPKPIPESRDPGMEYDSVAEALKGVSATPGIEWKIENGWPIAMDREGLAVWSFSPPGYPAHPAVVKRYVIPVGDNRSIVSMAIQCEASKSACDDLYRTFAKMNGFAVPE